MTEMDERQQHLLFLSSTLQQIAFGDSGAQAEITQVAHFVCKMILNRFIEVDAVYGHWTSL